MQNIKQDFYASLITNLVVTQSIKNSVVELQHGEDYVIEHSKIKILKDIEDDSTLTATYSPQKQQCATYTPNNNAISIFNKAKTKNRKLSKLAKKARRLNRK